MPVKRVSYAREAFMRWNLCCLSACIPPVDILHPRVQRAWMARKKRKPGDFEQESVFSTVFSARSAKEPYRLEREECSRARAHVLARDFL